MLRLLEQLQTLNLLEEHKILEFDVWVEQQTKKEIAKQKKEIKESDPFYTTYEDCWEMGFAYAGAIGGQYTLTITPTSIGEVVKVENCITGDKLDLTDYSTF